MLVHSNPLDAVSAMSLILSKYFNITCICVSKSIHHSLQASTYIAIGFVILDEQDSIALVSQNLFDHL
jgi:hypothetical protein